MKYSLVLMLALILALALAPVPCARAQNDRTEIVMRTALVAEQVASSGRVLLFSDAVERARGAGNWSTPRPGDSLTMPDGSQKPWNEVNAGDDGWLPLRGGSYAVWQVSSPVERVMILDASGHANVLVNGEPRTGDPYENGYVKLPVLLKHGENELVFRGGRGRVRARLIEPPAAVYLVTDDMTMPDLIRPADGRAADDQFGSMLLVNASDRPIASWTLSAVGPHSTHTLDVPRVPPLSVRKVRVPLGRLPSTAGGDIQVAVSAAPPPDGADTRTPTAGVTITLAVRSAGEPHKRTFISDIDGSVQYYSVVPIKPDSAVPAAERGLVLSLHGASVEATSQAAAYAPKDWCHVVCPTNRRPYGFDWEDWGRLDALEVLHDAARRFDHDPRRVYLTGHSMGGHGTWQLGAHFPDRFAAIAPSAGWSTFGSYGGGPPKVYQNGTLPQLLLRRASSPSDTIALSRNYAHSGVYILHGDADDNVPVSQARAMKELLAGFHSDVEYHEQPGAGHWWGSECVDWPPLFEFLRKHTCPLPQEARTLKFVTSSPGVSAACHWLTVHQAIKALEPSEVEASLDAAAERFTITTGNVAMLSIDPRRIPGGVHVREVVIDGQRVAPPPKVSSRPSLPPSLADLMGFELRGGSWEVADFAAQPRKHPERDGRFKAAFCNRVMLIHGTAGTAEENAWSLAKARFDAETFWYRGNGAIDVISDTEYVRQFSGPASGNGPLDITSRNAIIYGNRDTNAAWAVLLDQSPIQLTRTGITMPGFERAADNLACLFTFPMPRHAIASVGVISGTGLAGCRLTDRLPIFVSGVGIPDFVVLSTEMFRDVDRGLLGAGFFGNDWSVESGESAWLDASTTPNEK